MTWTKLSDDWDSHPSLIGVSRSARLLHLEALTWSVRHATDGRISLNALRRVGDSQNPDLEAAELVEAGAWTTVGAGWQLVVLLEDQPSAEEQKKSREATRVRQERHRRHVAGDHSQCNHPAPVTRDVTRDDGVSHAPPSRADPTRPATTGEEHPLTADAASTAPTAEPSTAEDDDEFDRFWGAYPRKVGKQTARKAWRAARRKVDLDAIRQALGVSLRAWREGGTPADKIPHPSTWLNREPWHDDPAAIAPRPAAPTRARQEREDIFAAAEARAAAQEQRRRPLSWTAIRQLEKDEATAAAYAEAEAFDAAVLAATTPTPERTP